MGEPVFTCDWFSQNIPALTEVLARFKGQPDIRVLEIGCFEGKGTLWFLDHLPGSHITCIDTFSGSQEHEHFKMDFGNTYNQFRSNTGWSNRVELMVGKSADELRKLQPGYDFIYVDGSHMAPDVLADMVLSWSLLKKGGVMFMDDYKWPGIDGNPLHTPKPAIDAFLNIYSEQLRVFHSGYSVAVEKL